MPVHDPTEDARELWPEFEDALNSLAEAQTSSSPSQMSDSDKQATEELGSLIVEFCLSLILHNLECVEFIFARLTTLKDHHPVLKNSIQSWMQNIQNEIKNHYNGLQLVKS